MQLHGRRGFSLDSYTVHDKLVLERHDVKVVVFSGIDMDLVVTTAHLPRPGETLADHTFLTIPADKGTNTYNAPTDAKSLTSQY